MLDPPQNNSKWIKDLNIRPQIIKLLEENRTLSDINHNKIIFDLPPRIMKTKINKWDLIKLKSFCTVEITINERKRQPSDLEKIFANEATDRRLISKINKQFMKFNIKKTNNSIKKRKKKGQKTLIDISPKKTYRRPRGT